MGSASILTMSVCAVAVTVAVKRFSIWLMEMAKYFYAVSDIGMVKPHWLFGHIKILTPTEPARLRLARLTEKFPKCMRMWIGPTIHFLYIHHPDIIKTVIGKNVAKDDTIYRYMKPWIGDGLVTSEGERWKSRRMLLTPAFHFNILKTYSEYFNKSTKEMMQKWQDAKKDTVQVEMFEDVGILVLSNILRCIFTKISKSQREESKEYRDVIAYITNAMLKRFQSPLLQNEFIYSLTEEGKKFKEACRTAHEYTERAIIEHRKEFELHKGENRKPTNFLDILFSAKDNNGNGITHKEVCDQVNTFVFAGHDTVKCGLSWLFYNLAMHPEYQEKCREEIKTVLEDRDHVEWNDISKFIYVTKFIKESLRLHPPAVAITRKTKNPVFCPRGFGSDQYNCDFEPSTESVPSKTLPKNLNITINILPLHRNAHIWKNPDVFDPERFSPDNIAKRQPLSFMPFSAGPRNCIGQQFAMIEMKITMALTLSRFRFTIDESYPKAEIAPSIVLHAKNGIHLKVEKL